MKVLSDLTKDGASAFAGGGGGGGSLSVNRIATGSAQVQNIWGNKPFEKKIKWTVPTSDPAFVNVLFNERFVFQQDTIVSLHATMAVTDSVANNRTTFVTYADHKADGGALIDRYIGTSVYIRDDNDAYDSGVGVVSPPAFSASDGDYVEFYTQILDEGSTTGTMNLDPVWSLLKMNVVEA